MKHTRKRQSSYPSEVNTHKKAVTFLMHKYGLSRDRVESILHSFFGKSGMKFFLNRCKEITITGLGRFYFHGNTVKKYEKERAKKELYNKTEKQRIYRAKLRGEGESEEIIALKKKFNRL